MDAKKLQKLELFSDLNHSEAEGLAAIAQKSRVMEGETLCRRGDTSSNFYIILSGNFMMVFNKGKAITLHERGQIAGWATLSPFRYKNTTISLTDGEVISIDGSELMRLVQGNSVYGELLNKIHSILSETAPLLKDDEES